MQIAMAHSNADFDSLASQFAVTKLYPDTKIVAGHPLSANIREFLALYRDVLPIADLQYVDPAQIEHIYVVDCQQAERLDDIGRKLILEKKCFYTVFDHHAIDPDGLISGASKKSIIRPAGACTTLLVEKLMEANTPLAKWEATLLALGIYEDSGCLTYGGTTPVDAECVAYLLRMGADVAQITNFMNPKLSEQQTALFQELITNNEVVSLSGGKVVVAWANCSGFIEGLATLTRRLLETVSADAAFTVVFMRDRVHIVGRSDKRFLNARDLLQTFGGGGHPGAASAVVKDKQVAEVVGDVLALVKRIVTPEIQAADIMRPSVRTITPATTMEEAARLMLRYGEDGLIVMESETIAGVVSKRDIDKALHHRLGHAPVKGFMTRPVLTIDRHTPLSAIQEKMVSEDIGRLPVVDEQGKLTGIVTRREVLRTLFGGKDVAGNGALVTADKRRLHLQKKLQSLEPSTDWLFRQIGIVAASLNMVAYAVGGCVRDLYMDRQNFDLDFVIEGNAIQLAQALERSFPGRFEVVRTHDRFQTATVSFFGEQRREVDLSTARVEFYEHPAALPTVEASVLEQDMFRRDFTINALAISVDPKEFGDLIDFFHGIEDIDARLIRVLHKFSFDEDPTRIIRAARFAARLGFSLEETTREQAERSIQMGVFDNLGGFRLKEELKLILDADTRLSALDLLNELGGGLRYLASGLEYDHVVRRSMRRAERLLQRNPLPDSWIVYLGTILAALPDNVLESVMERLVLGTDERQWIRDGRRILHALGATASRDKRAPRSTIFRVLEGQSLSALAIAASVSPPGSPTRRWIRLYLEELQEVHVSLSGKDLLQMGLPQGPLIKEVLDRLREARLDQVVASSEQELQYVKINYGHYCR